MKARFFASRSWFSASFVLEYFITETTGEHSSCESRRCVRISNIHHTSGTRWCSLLTPVLYVTICRHPSASFKEAIVEFYKLVKPQPRPLWTANWCLALNSWWHRSHWYPAVSSCLSSRCLLMLYLSRALKGHKEQEYLPPPVGLAWLLTTSENTAGQFKCEETGAIRNFWQLFGIVPQRHS